MFFFFVPSLFKRPLRFYVFHLNYKRVRKRQLQASRHNRNPTTLGHQNHLIQCNSVKISVIACFVWLSLSFSLLHFSKACIFNICFNFCFIFTLMMPSPSVILASCVCVCLCVRKYDMAINWNPSVFDGEKQSKVKNSENDRMLLKYLFFNVSFVFFLYLSF